jgi:hypothetical protein
MIVAHVASRKAAKRCMFEIPVGSSEGDKRVVGTAVVVLGKSSCGLQQQGLLYCCELLLH